MSGCFRVEACTDGRAETVGAGTHSVTAVSDASPRERFRKPSFWGLRAALLSKFGPHFARVHAATSLLDHGFANGVGGALLSDQSLSAGESAQALPLDMQFLPIPPALPQVFL